jgi:hypothetical protein
MKPLMPPQRCACGRELPCFDHRPAAQTSEPRTAAGRRLVEGDAKAELDPDEVRALVLAIEAEAAALPAAPAGLDAIFQEHRECGTTPGGYNGCYAHWPMPHCRADGMQWPCDVSTIAAAYAEGEPE